MSAPKTKNATLGSCTEAAAQLFRLMASPDRLRLAMLCREPRRVGDLAAVTGLGQTTVSRHLSMLRMGRVLEAKRQGKGVCYVVRPDAEGAIGRLWEIVEACVR